MGTISSKPGPKRKSCAHEEGTTTPVEALKQAFLKLNLQCLNKSHVEPTDEPTDESNKNLDDELASEFPNALLNALIDSIKQERAVGWKAELPLTILDAIHPGLAQWKTESVWARFDALHPGLATSHTIKSNVSKSPFPSTFFNVNNPPSLQREYDFNICDQFLKTISPDKKELVECLDIFSKTTLIKSLRILQQSQLFERSHAKFHFNAVMAHPNKTILLNTLINAQNAHLLSVHHVRGKSQIDPRFIIQKIFNAIVSHQDPVMLDRALVGSVATQWFNAEKGYSIHENFHALAINPNPASVLDCLETITVAQTHSCVSDVNIDDKGKADALMRIRQFDLTSHNHAQATFDKVALHPNSAALADMLRILSKNGLLSTECAYDNFQAIANYHEPESMLEVLKSQDSNGLFSNNHAQENLISVIAHLDLAMLPNDPASLSPF